jgi:multiple sugar transport system substrate-binding protein
MNDLVSRFALDILQEKYDAQRKSNQPVGLPTNLIFKGDFQQQLTDLATKNANVPLQNYLPLTKSTLTLRAEPPVETQKMYASLDAVVQAVLTDRNANPKSLLDKAVQQFQATVLDKTSH